MTRQKRQFMRQGVSDLPTRVSVKAYVGAPGEPIFDFSTLRMQDGVTPGGIPLLSPANDLGLTPAEQAQMRLNIGVPDPDDMPVSAPQQAALDAIVGGADEPHGTLAKLGALIDANTAGVAENKSNIVGLAEATLDAVNGKADVEALNTRAGVITPEAYGYAPGATPAVAASAVNAALAAAEAAGQASVYLKDTYTVDGTFTPSDKVGFVGPGRLKRATQYGRQQLTSYADTGHLIGREYLVRAMRRIQLGPSGASSTLKVFTYGDSTVEGFVNAGPGLPGYVFNSNFLVQNLLPELLLRQGIVSSVTNRGVSSTRWGDLNALPDLSTTTDLLIIKYGINDAVMSGDRLATMASTMRAKLQAIRAATNGDLGNLSIVLVGPTSTADDTNGRNEEWYEQVRQVYLRAARDFKCAYFDAYAFMRDARAGVALWLDTTSVSSGEVIGIHPLEPAAAALWGGLVQALFPKEIVGRNAPNRFVLTGSNFENADVNKTPAAYAPGLTVQWGAGTWPMYGLVTTLRGVDNAAVQTLADYGQSGRPRVMTRAGSGSTWSPWSGKVEGLTLANGWGNLYGALMYAHMVTTNDGLVMLGGEITNGTVTAGTVITTLPAGARPVATQRFVVATNGGTAVLAVAADGTVSIVSGATATSLSLSGIVFKTA